MWQRFEVSQNQAANSWAVRRAPNSESHSNAGVFVLVSGMGLPAKVVGMPWLFGQASSSFFAHYVDYSQH